MAEHEPERKAWRRSWSRWSLILDRDRFPHLPADAPLTLDKDRSPLADGTNNEELTQVNPAMRLRWSSSVAEHKKYNEQVGRDLEVQTGTRKRAPRTFALDELGVTTSTHAVSGKTMTVGRSGDLGGRGVEEAYGAQCAGFSRSRFKKGVYESEKKLEREAFEVRCKQTEMNPCKDLTPFGIRKVCLNHENAENPSNSTFALITVARLPRMAIIRPFRESIFVMVRPVYVGKPLKPWLKALDPLSFNYLQQPQHTPRSTGASGGRQWTFYRQEYYSGASKCAGYPRRTSQALNNLEPELEGSQSPIRVIKKAEKSLPCVKFFTIVQGCGSHSLGVTPPRPQYSDSWSSVEKLASSYDRYQLEELAAAYSTSSLNIRVDMSKSSLS
ncbi:hypothetical protein C8R45DRAFT_918238 [Mycena sanguinolenta]|nr:hypothetical protein C8R45DRAFT_918238 [Mycena sanguinolenta]